MSPVAIQTQAQSSPWGKNTPQVSELVTTAAKGLTHQLVELEQIHTYLGPLVGNPTTTLPKLQNYGLGLPKFLFLEELDEGGKRTEIRRTSLRAL